jgi:hypothetical protein
MQGLVTNKIDFLINEGEEKGYVYIAIKTKDSPDGMSKIHGATKLFAPQSMHDQMTKDIPLFKGLFNGMYNKIVILHDPTMPNVEPKETGAKKMSNVAKGKIKTMFKDGMPVEEIAMALDLDLEKVKEYTSKL